MASDRLGTPRPPRASRTAPLELLNTITRSLDPGARSAREEERTARSLQATQLLTLSNQLRNAQAALEAARNHTHTAERRADNAELELRMERMTRGRQDYRSPYYRSPSPRRRNPSPRRRSPTPHRSLRVRRETRYRSGGGSVMWVTPSDEEEERAQRGGSVDSDIEWQQYGTPAHHTPRRHPSRRRRSASPRSHTGSRRASRVHAEIDRDHMSPVSPFRAVSEEI